MQHVTHLRVRYSEVDPMGSYYNSRVLEWFECGRNEACRATGKPYSQWEEDGVMLPVTEAHIEYVGRAVYDDHLKLTTTVSMPRRARIRFDVTIENAETGQPVVRGYTVHAVTNGDGKPIRPPDWVRALLDDHSP